MLVTLLGVRGSAPAVGSSFLRYGGHTSCVAIARDAAGAPDLVLDAGSGIRDLGSLTAGVFSGSVLLTHLHWDHVQGLPFAEALMADAAGVEVCVPVVEGGDPLAALLPGFSPPAFPVRPDELGAGWRFRAAEPEMTAGSWQVRTAVVQHKGGRTLGVRVEADGRALGYLPDHALTGPDPSAVALMAGADVLLHDAQYLDAELLRFGGFGHSSIEQACAFADAVGVGRLVLTHHAPGRTDDELDRIADRFSTTPGGIPVEVARQGDRFRL